MTLGVILTLGGVTGSRGQELLGSVTPANLADGLVLPALPENWADLPFTLTASETVSYNNNILGAPLGTAVPSGESRGDFTSATNFGFATHANVYGQQVFFDLSYGVIRYLHNVDFDSNVYTIHAGVNWTLTSRCSGTLDASESKSPSLITELVGTGVNYGTTTNIGLSAKCAVSNGYSLLFNTGLTESTNSNSVNAVNNSRSTMLSAGIEYAQGASTVTALATNSNTSYTARTAADEALGLATATDFHTFSLNYARQINANLSLSGSVGLVGVTSGFTLGLPKTLLPIYTLTASWALTPKLSLSASASRTVSPPLTVIANAEVGYNATMGMSYQVTPKLGFNLGGSIGYTSAAFTPGLVGTVNAVFLGNQNFYTADAGLSYTMTPFLSAALNATYTERVSNHLITPQNLVTVSLSYRPY